ncbi:MAG: 1-acyl-sn-glycerol-3-phosphate acyltransferase [Bdellovibrionales bacterium]|nr:1-acyl-sn-glycerol-3-phosphate acyltransferase [Bdellovibrionales bacterium]
MGRILKILFFVIVVRPVVTLIMGLNIRHRERLPSQGPAILVANHNSHLDTAVLMSLFPLLMIHRVKAVAAADYFMKTSWLRFFSQNMIGIIPISRKKEDREGDPLQGISEELGQGTLVIFFPEGSRGEPEKMSEFKFGIAKLAERFPRVPIYPIFLQGLGKSLPRGESLFVPFFCDIVIGEPTFKNEDSAAFVQRLATTVSTLSSEVRLQEWN